MDLGYYVKARNNLINIISIRPGLDIDVISWKLKMKNIERFKSHLFVELTKDRSMVKITLLVVPVTNFILIRPINCSTFICCSI